jgi:phosphoenolpyruvate carboxylase
MAANVSHQIEQSTRSTNKTLKRLVSVLGIEPETIYKCLSEQTVELVFTAHPTQVCSFMEYRYAMQI